MSRASRAAASSILPSFGPSTPRKNGTHPTWRLDASRLCEGKQRLLTQHAESRTKDQTPPPRGYMALEWLAGVAMRAGASPCHDPPGWRPLGPLQSPTGKVLSPGRRSAAKQAESRILERKEKSLPYISGLIWMRAKPSLLESAGSRIAAQNRPDRSSEPRRVASKKFAPAFSPLRTRARKHGPPEGTGWVNFGTSTYMVAGLL